MNDNFSKQPKQRRLKQIPNFKQAKKIIRILYAHNDIEQIDPLISKAQNTQQIDLSYNKITSIQNIYHLRMLRVVNLSNNNISIISKGILKLMKLQYIDLSFNRIALISNINPLFQLLHIRKGELKLQLQGNKIYQDHQDFIKNKIQHILLDSHKGKQNIQMNFDFLCRDNTYKIKNKVINNSTTSLNLKLKEQIDQQDKIYNVSAQQINKILNQQKQRLISYQNKFSIIAKSQFKGWNPYLIQVLTCQQKLTFKFIQVHKNIIMQCLIQSTSSNDKIFKVQELFVKSLQLHQQIKEQYKILLKELNKMHNANINMYKIWIKFYNQLREIGQKIKQHARFYLKCEIRNKQIQNIKMISPNKIQIKDSSIKSELTQNKQLQVLLFSKKKQSLLQDKQPQCCECFVKNEQVRQLKQIVELLTVENASLKQFNYQLTKQNQKTAQSNQILQNKLFPMQQDIINLIQSKMGSSVYQKILLEQAKGIQTLLKYEKYPNNKHNLNDNTKKYQNFYQTTASFEKQKIIPYFQQNIVSQFNQNQSRNLQNIQTKIPYFKTIQSASLSKKNLMAFTTEITSTQKKNKKSRETKNQKSKTFTSKNKLFFQRQKQIRSHKHENSIIQKTQMISQYNYPQITNKVQCSLTTKNQNLPINRNQINRIESQKTKINRKSIQSIRNNNQTKIQKQAPIEKCNSKFSRNTITEQQSQKLDCNYLTRDYHSVELNNTQPYDKYIQFHLRKNIANTLSRDGKNHKLIKYNTKFDSNQTIKLVTTRQSTNLNPKSIIERKNKNDEFKNKRPKIISNLQVLEKKLKNNEGPYSFLLKNIR